MLAWAIFLFASLALADTAIPRTRLTLLNSQSSLDHILATCPAGKTTCEDGCMTIGRVCCDDGSGETCDPGTYCVSGGCCPNGKTCSGVGGPATCEPGDLACGAECILSTATCCSNGISFYASSGSCCAYGDDCDSTGSGSGSGATTTYGSSSPTTSIEIDDFFTFTAISFPPRPTRGVASGHSKADGRIAAGCVVAAALL
ncbi:hypothetical protein HD806DRAFT_515873, partial [Xylariaceae sp. AK1471]